MTQVVSGMRTAGRKQVPGNTQVVLTNAGVGGKVHARLKLPGAKDFCELRDVPIVNGEIVLPVYTVFLCHAREDEPVVDRISRKLLADGFVTWFAASDLLPGDDWEQKIREAIKASDFFLVFLSSQSFAKTGYVQEQMRVAFEQIEKMPDGKRFILPLLIDDCVPPSSFARIPWIRMSDQNWYEKLIKAMRTST